MKDTPNEKISTNIDLILQSAERITHQLKTVMDFVKDQPKNISANSVLALLNDAIKTTPIPNDVKISMPHNDQKIECDASQLVVVFSNFITNSIQAMNDKGNIVINLEVKNPNVVIEFVDTGP